MSRTYDAMPETTARQLAAELLEGYDKIRFVESESTPFFGSFRIYARQVRFDVDDVVGHGGSWGAAVMNLAMRKEAHRARAAEIIREWFPERWTVALQAQGMPTRTSVSSRYWASLGQGREMF